MDRSTFESADPILDKMEAMLDQLLDSDQFAAVRLLLARLSETVGPRYSVNLSCGPLRQRQTPDFWLVVGSFLGLGGPHQPGGRIGPRICADFLK